MKNKNPIDNKILEISVKLDLAYESRDIEEIKRLIYSVKKVENSFDELSKIQLFYSIGTAFGNIFELSEGSIFNYDSEYIIQQIYYFRKAISISNKIEIASENMAFIHPILCSLYTNYGNLLDAYGRKQLAIEMYRKAMKINSEFTMASGNLAISLDHYRYFVNETEQFHFVKEIKSLLENALFIVDPNRFSMAEERFLKLYESYSAFDVSRECTCKDYEYNSISQDYSHWCHKNLLYLNPLNDLQSNEVYRYDDNLLLPNLLGNSKEDPTRYFSMFNQIKQEYIYARYLCFNSLEVDEVHFADENVSLIDCLDYTQYSVRIEGLKTAFKTLYSLLDKVALLLNEYFSIGISIRNINFHSIWNRSNVLKELLNKNIGLLSIYWITKDFDYESDSMTANPDSKKLKKIRNYLEHRFTNVTLDFYYEEKNSTESRLFLTEKELRRSTIDLLHLTREVIFSLKNAIQIHEYQKRELLGDNAIALPISLREFDLEDKL
ncbi:LA2681 family HEPN domain-containing protein [Streptococcus agalactiae]|uniref:LA2681 family HEPN domain-containing protein n=1 Tax=Streptococcus agalactiae TaxID=1311 RepID=UPI001375222D|nr:LA2681 family HEPN domain-containing protein [Streptococcus agalactiae]KAF1125345.1 hypothetical protein B8U92_10945 [Streptococcus agalactiae]